MGLIIEMLTFLLEVLGLEMIMLQLWYKALDALVIWRHIGLVVPTILWTPDGLTEKREKPDDIKTSKLKLLTVS